MRIPIIAGNWKMNKTLREALEFSEKLKKELAKLTDRICLICPPFTALASVGEILKGSNIELGSQNIFWEANGAFTGEISGSMIKDAGASYCIIGHSERRKILGETDEMVHRKVKKALSDGLLPIVCVGETLEEREKNLTFDLIRTQVTQGLKGLEKQEISKCVVAYEPVWAIGTGRNATPQQAEEVHAHIRKIVKEFFGSDIADKIRIQYGGSVTLKNIDELMREPNIDGALVGGASLDVTSFARIVNFKI
ncbi:MAG: triose-phosphate isomerase [Chlamydiae bacterium]|nr:triose-phosphate isomerase [Chlamydiota bacterium]MBI3277629.1 triose-phosphate isomerase [Chlamydiota bacterium]